MRDSFFNTEPDLTPARIAEITGLSTDSQRDWRRRGVINGIGVQQPNGRWLYDSFDALMLYTMRQLAASSIDLLGARWLCHDVCPLVVGAAINARGVAPDLPRGARFRIAYPDPTARGGWSLAPAYRDPINGLLFAGMSPRKREEAAPEIAPVCLLIDLRMLGTSLPPHFDELLPHAAEGTLEYLQACKEAAKREREAEGKA